MLPSFFIAHGSPMLALENNEYTQCLNHLGRSLPKPKGIIVFSAHWLSLTQKVSDVDEYETIYDFYGFPEDLYRIKYPAIGNKEITKAIVNLFNRDGIPFRTDESRGLDHGAWVVLRMLYPNADVPVISMSVNPSLAPKEQYKIGAALCELREKDILIIGSGGIIHNLRVLQWNNDNGVVEQWALDFDDWIENGLKTWNVDALFQYDALAPNAQLAVPPNGNEHFIPLFYAMGAADNNKQATLLHQSYRYGSLSHSIWKFG